MTRPIQGTNTQECHADGLTGARRTGTRNDLKGTGHPGDEFELINMKIGIIGAGEIGGALTRRLTALGHQVSVANSRGPETLVDLARETGA